MATTDTVQMEQFIIYPYLGAKILVYDRHIVLDESYPFRAAEFDNRNVENKEPT